MSNVMDYTLQQSVKSVNVSNNVLSLKITKVKNI